MIEVLVGVMAASWLFTVAGVAYAFWRYAYHPWLIMRRDMAALDQKVNSTAEMLRQEMGLRAARALSDEELVRAESAQRRLATRSAVLGR